MKVARPVTRLPFSSTSIAQIITSHQYAMISIILEIVWLIFSSPLLLKIAKYLLLCMKLTDYCIVSNLVHQASITYIGGFITTALILNLSFSCGTVPLQWRQAVVTPVPKVAKPSTLYEYRPISVTPLLSRKAEKLVVSRWILPAIPSHSTMDQWTYSIGQT